MDERSRAFGARLLEITTGHALTMMIDIGHRTGLFEALARGSATSAELADRVALAERHVREWLGATTTGGITEIDPATGRYSLPAEHAALLRGVGPSARMLDNLAAVLPDVIGCFATGDGLPYAAYAAVAGASMGESWRRVYDEQLVDGFVAAVPGLTERLAAGARVLDLGCGTGHALRVLAAAFPASTYMGVDIAPEAIELARRAPAPATVTFEVGDAAELPPDPTYDVVFAFDAIHDQRAPAVVLGRIRDALAPDGVFVMVDTRFSSRVENNIGNPYAPVSYAISTLFCVPLAAADGGAALGAAWGTELATEMLAAAGFTQVTVLDAPRPQNCIVVCRTA